MTTVAVSANSMAPWKTEIGRNTDRVVADLRSERRDRAGIPIVGTGGGALLRKPVKVIYPQAAKDRGVGGVVSVRAASCAAASGKAASSLTTDSGSEAA